MAGWLIKSDSAARVTPLRHQGVKGEQQIEVELVQFRGDYSPCLWDN